MKDIVFSAALDRFIRGDSPRITKPDAVPNLMKVAKKLVISVSKEEAFFLKSFYYRKSAEDDRFLLPPSRGEVTHFVFFRQ